LVGTSQTLRTILCVREAFLRQAGLPDIRFHDLRHTAAGLMLHQGIHPNVVQERLSHSKINITVDIHSHVLPGLQDDAAAKLN
jgi:integrase